MTTEGVAPAAVAPEEEMLPVTAGAAGGPAPVRYEFDRAFQSKIAALVLRDNSFAQKTQGLIQPQYFESPAEGVLVDCVLRYFERYKKIPGDAASLVHIISKDLKKGIIRPEMQVPIKTCLRELLRTDISDRDLVADEVATFARHQAVERAILDSVDRLNKHDFDAISTMLRKALDTGVNHVATEYDYGEQIEARTEERLERAAGRLPPTGISTGYEALDRHLHHRGWGRSELSVIMGSAKMGKTTALINFGINAAGHLHRYNVLYVTLEVAARIIAERMDANISDRVVSELNEHIHDVKDRVRAFKARAGRFVMHEFPTGTMTVSDLRRIVERHKSNGLKFDLVIVDYADLMAPERFTDSPTENSKSVYVALRGFAMQEGCAVLTATQTNREGAKKAVATMTDVAEDFNKIRIADVVISVNKTDDERALNQARLYFAASRNQRSGFSIRIEQDIDRMKFIKTVIGEE